jgi:hypothetical protein
MTLSTSTAWILAVRRSEHVAPHGDAVVFNFKAVEKRADVVFE